MHKTEQGMHGYPRAILHEVSSPMFAIDNPAIQQYAWRDHESMYRTLLFVRLSIRRHLEMVRPLVDMVMTDGPGILKNRVERESCIQLSALAGHYLAMYPEKHLADPLNILRDAVKVHGIGIVKAGFITQLLTGAVGCLDTHNIKLHGIKGEFRVRGSWGTVEARLSQYVALCQYLGGSEWLWNIWCQHVANIRPKVWPTAESVSRYHVDSILGL